MITDFLLRSESYICHQRNSILHHKSKNYVTGSNRNQMLFFNGVEFERNNHCNILQLQAWFQTNFDQGFQSKMWKRREEGKTAFFHWKFFLLFERISFSFDFFSWDAFKQKNGAYKIGMTDCQRFEISPLLVKKNKHLWFDAADFKRINGSKWNLQNNIFLPRLVDDRNCSFAVAK